MLPDDPDAQARLFYLALLGMALAGGVFYNYRDRLGTAAQHAAIWVLIFLGVTIAYGFKDQLASQLYPGTAQPVDERTIALRRADDGHFYARVRVNGAEIRFMVDTGATNLVLSQQDARRIGLAMDNLNYVLPVSTANGTVYGAGVVLERVKLGGFVDTDVRAMVNGGRMSVSLLGMSYLDRFRRFSVEGDRLLLSR
ncbi:MAG: TIGR02281 family clan AA aspartic protease [Proteobacteria bacterium]|nr:TIGR02281 family clan AA aspartic protease [Pseudomonadota bacterium]